LPCVFYCFIHGKIIIYLLVREFIFLLYSPDTERKLLKVMDNIIKINTSADIPPEYSNTPIGLLLEYHNLGKPFDVYDRAQLLVGMCMDNRKHLNIPENFAYIIRSGGANLRYSEFKVSYAIAVGNVRHIALIGHNNCGMVNLVTRKHEFIEGMVENAGWEREKAEEHFMQFAPMYEIGNEKDFVLSETKRLSSKYPKVIIAPMLYLVRENKLYLLKE
jgi:carbonic anhydrase